MAAGDENGGAGEQAATMSEMNKAALLVVIGEPFSGDHKDLLLKRITEGKPISLYFVPDSSRFVPGNCQLVIWAPAPPAAHCLSACEVLHHPQADHCSTTYFARFCMWHVSPSVKKKTQISNLIW